MKLNYIFAFACFFDYVRRSLRGEPVVDDAGGLVV